MWNFNLVVTQASGGRYRRLLEDLQPLGEFHRTEFLGVILGKVSDPAQFLEALREQQEKRFTAFSDLGRVVPVDQVFTFAPDAFLSTLCRAVASYLDRLAGRSFYVRLERRGHKGEIISPEVERSVDAYLSEALAAHGRPGRIDFSTPDAIVAVETVGDRCGTGLLTRDLLDRYRFVRIG